MRSASDRMIFIIGKEIRYAKDRTEIIEIIGYLLGFSVLLYPTVVITCRKRNATTIVSSYEQILQDIQPEENGRSWSRQQHTMRHHSVKCYRRSIFNGTQTEDEAYLNTLDLDGNGMMGYLKIPRSA